MPLRLGTREFADDEFAVMAIINRTPDSFFDQGATFDTDVALRAVDLAVADGAEHQCVLSQLMLSENGANPGG